MQNLLKPEPRGKPMKKIFLAVLLLFILTMTACGSSQVNAVQASAGMPAATLLVVGTLQLEGTQQAVTGEQAGELLPMWQVYQSLTESGTAAQAEIDGLVEQIQETMTAGQMESISAMNLTQQDVFALMQEQGGGMGQAPQGSSGSTSTQSGGGFALPDGGAPPGGGSGGGAPPDGGMADMGGTGPSTSLEQNQGTEAAPGAGRTAGVPATLVETLIQLLEQRAGS
jgi:hypothetical protein